MTVLSELALSLIDEDCRNIQGEFKRSNSSVLFFRNYEFVCKLSPVNERTKNPFF